MKNILLTITLLLLFFSSGLLAQSSDELYDQAQASGQNYIFLKGNKLLLEGDFTYKEGGIFGTGEPKFFYKDGKEIDSADIIYYSTDKVAAAQIGSVTINGLSKSTYSSTSYARLSKISKRGYFDIYYTVTSSSDVEGRTSSRKNYYYSRKFDDLKPASYENLKADFVFSDDPTYRKANINIMKLLEIGEKNKTAGPKLMLTGLTVGLIGAVVSLIGEKKAEATGNSSHPLERIGLGISLGGTVAMVAGLSKWSSPQRTNIKALRKYNEVYFK